MRYWLYRKFWEFTHRHNWHHMKVIGPLEDGRRQAWCQWCGLRDWFYDPSLAKMQIRAEILMKDADEGPR